MRRMPSRYLGDMCCSPSTSLPAARCSWTCSSVSGASSSMGVADKRLFLAGMTLDLRSASYSLSTVSSSHETPRVRAEVSDQLLTLTLDRPERRNALDSAMRDELAGALDEAARSPSVSAVVITGAGGSFCAGGDLDAFEDL